MKKKYNNIYIPIISYTIILMIIYAILSLIYKNVVNFIVIISFIVLLSTQSSLLKKQ